MSALCPHCGYDLALDEVLCVGDLEIDPRGAVRWQQIVVDLSPAERSILQTIAKAGGRPVTWEVIAERYGYDGDNPRGLVATFICRLRGKMPDIPLANVWGQGWRWAA